jgi:hypothetical protein
MLNRTTGLLLGFLFGRTRIMMLLILIVYLSGLIIHLSAAPERYRLTEHVWRWWKKRLCRGETTKMLCTACSLARSGFNEHATSERGVITSKKHSCSDVRSFLTNPGRRQLVQIYYKERRIVFLFFTVLYDHKMLPSRHTKRCTMFEKCDVYVDMLFKFFTSNILKLEKRRSSVRRARKI